MESGFLLPALELLQSSVLRESLLCLEVLNYVINEEEKLLFSVVVQVLNSK